MESTGALMQGPADQLITGLDVESGARKEKDRDGLVVDECDVAEGEACNAGLMKVKVFLKAAFKLFALLLFD